MEGFYLEMPTTYLLPKEIQGLLKGTVQGKAELEGRYSKLFTDKVRLGNLILVQVEGIRNATVSKLKLDTMAFELEMSSLKADYGINKFDEVRDRLAADTKAIDTRTYPPGYTANQATKLHLERMKLNLVIAYEKLATKPRRDWTA